MESPTRPSRTPKNPLFPLSPGRANRIASGADSTTSESDVERKRQPRPLPPQSPSLPDFNLSASKGLDLSSRDVQGIVARFDALDIKDHAELRKKDAAALRRAQMGREEAECELKKTREEVRRMKKEAEESAERERRLAKRLEIVSDDLTHEKEIRATGIGKYEKEMRTARKEAFKSSSAMVKLQEELKATRASLNKLRTDHDTEKGRARQREQEAFSAQYELVGVQEALQKETERCKVIESERDALKTQLKEEEVARVAAEGMIALPKPAATHEDDEFASPRKPKTPSVRTQKQDAMVTRLQLELQDLKEEIDGLQFMKDEAESQVDFMKMECQFRCCSCRVAEQSGDRFMHDASLAETMTHIRPESRFAFEAKPDIVMEESSTQPVPEGVVPSRPTTPALTQQAAEVSEEDEKKDVIFSPQSGTFRRSSAATQPLIPDTATEPQTTSQEQKAIASDNVTTERPTVYINGNGHVHEEEHQPRRRTRHSVKQDDRSLDDTIVHTPADESLVAHADEELHNVAEHELDEADEPQDMSFPSPTKSDDAFSIAADADADADEDEDEDFLIQSPTAHIAATTVTTTVPLAPLSSPSKPLPSKPTAPSTQRTPLRHAPAPTDTTTTTATHDFAATHIPPHNDKENADPSTPHPAPAAKSTPGTPLDAASAPWTPLGTNGLTREEAIERLRARRERERAKTPCEPRPGVTPLRAASHGHVAHPAPSSNSTASGNGSASATRRAGAVATPGRRDISAPEARSVRR